MIKIEIKPLSTNDAWMGRRFKTSEYKAYEELLFYLLPKKVKIPEGKIKATYIFGLSSKAADGDNCIKQFQDILSKKYKFNDNRIYKWDIEKVDVKKGEEYLKFSLKKLSPI